MQGTIGAQPVQMDAELTQSVSNASILELESQRTWSLTRCAQLAGEREYFQTQYNRATNDKVALTAEISQLQARIKELEANQIPDVTIREE